MGGREEADGEGTKKGEAKKLNLHKHNILPVFPTKTKSLLVIIYDG